MRVTLSLGLVLVLAGAVQAQSNVGVEVEDVTDNRMSSSGPSALQMVGALELRLKVTGTNLDKAAAARVIVKEAKDDKGTSLLGKPFDPPDFMPREYNSGTLQLRVDQPARTASTVRIKGTIELYVPSRDPNANLKIEKALAKLDAPLSSKALKTAKIDLTPLSRDGYAKQMKARKITEDDIAKMRAEGKKQGADEKEIEMAIELAKAFEGMDGELLPENAVVLAGKKADFDRIYRVEILGTDGNPLNLSSRGSSSRGESAIMTLNPSEAPPANAVLQVMLLTDKAKVSFPFDLKVELP
jgi:hypothetical protein